MNNLNIPIYRAKKTNSNEYVDGFLFDGNKITSISRRYIDSMDRKFILPVFDEVDVLTLSIHFPDMLDSQGNKIFASLSEDGKGGDIIEIDNTELTRIAMYKNGKFILEENIDIVNKYLIFKVIGIQE